MNNILEIQGGQKHYEVISFFKGFSIITIVLMHLIQMYMKSCPGMVSKAASIGGTGVQVFFLCSGFGLYLSHIRKPLKYTEFLKKRFLKIYVPYIIVVAISAMIPFMYEGNSVYAFFSHALLYKMFVPKLEVSFGVHFWFMSTLFQFYLGFIPLCCIKKKIGGRLFLAIAVIISVCWWIFTAAVGINTERVWGSFFLQYLWEFALGMVLAEKAEQGTTIRLYIAGLVFASVFGLGLAAVTGLKGGVLRTFNDIPALAGYGAFALLVYSIHVNWVRRGFLWVSQISYELYLVHILVFSVIFTLTDVQGKAEYIAGTLAMVFAVAAAYLYHEILGKKLNFRKCWS